MNLHDDAMNRLGRPNVPDLEQRVRELVAEVAQARADRDDARQVSIEDTAAREEAEAENATLRAELQAAQAKLEQWQQAESVRNTRAKVHPTLAAAMSSWSAMTDSERVAELRSARDEARRPRHEGRSAKPVHPTPAQEVDRG